MIVVQCDFDDTITVGKVGAALAEPFDSDGWLQIEEDYRAGKYSVEECNIRQYAVLKASREDIRQFVHREIIFREAFAEFVSYCQRQSIRFVIVSSGLDAYISPILSKYGLENLETNSGRANFKAHGIQVEYFDPSGRPIMSGFKESYVRHFKKSGHTVVYFGDGVSDIIPSQEADYVFARSSLKSYLEDRGLPYYSFETFREPQRYLEEIMNQIE